MTLHGADVSAYQPNWRPDPEDAFAFVKATEGRTYTSATMVDQARRARKAGVALGFYHFLWPGDAVAQADYFLRQTEFKRGDMLVCDWETTGGGHPSVGDAAKFLARLKEKAPECRTLLYCNRFDWVQTAVKAGDGLWLAAYVDRHGITSPKLKFWQYTSKPIDQNVGYFDDRAALDTWLLGTPPPAQQLPLPAGEVVPTLTIPTVSKHDAKVRFRGGWTCPCVAFSLPLVEQEMIRRRLIKRSIDIYQLGYRGDVAASGASHDAGGNTDTGQYHAEQIRCWRECGWAMQDRSPYFDFDHGHGWPVGCPHLSTTGKANGASQARAWMRGDAGLARPLKIAGPGPKGTDTPTWQHAAAELLAA